MIQVGSNTDYLLRKGYKILKIVFNLLLGLSFFIFTQDVHAFSFNFEVPNFEDVIIPLLGAGIVGFIALGRRRLKK